MGYLVDANKAWKQAQAILIDVQIDIWFAVNEIGSHDYYQRAIDKLQSALDNDQIIDGDSAWVTFLIHHLIGAAVVEYEPQHPKALLLPNATRQEQRNHDLGHLYTFQRKALDVQKQSLPHFEATAKRAYHDRMFAQMQADDALTKGSPLERIISKQDEHLGNLYP